MVRGCLRIRKRVEKERVKISLSTIDIQLDIDSKVVKVIQ
jgi:hypothetical protein